MKSFPLIFFVAIASGGSLTWAKAVVQNFGIADCCSQNQICNEEIPICLEHQIQPISSRTDVVGKSAARNTTNIREEEEDENEDGEKEQEGEPEDEEEQEEESNVVKVESPSDGESDDCENDIDSGSDNESESEADDVMEKI